jgi:hypothetical protein
MRRLRSWASVALALALVTGACSEPTSYDPLSATPTASPTPAKSSAAPKASRPPSRTATAAPSPTQGELRMVVLDEDDLEPRPDVPISYTGKRSGRVVSGAGGVAKVRLPAGDYRVEVVAGCHARLEVFSGSGGNAGVVAGDEPTAARLTVRARQRYFGGTPLQHDVPVPWPTGKLITFRYRLYDRCKDVEAPKASVGAIRYRTSSNLEVIGTPAKAADGSSDVILQIRCSAPGDASLIIYDKDNDDDALDLLRLRPPSVDPSEQWCGS